LDPNNVILRAYLTQILIVLSIISRCSCCPTPIRELNSELAKKNPDSKKSGALQKELSGLKGQLDQKRTEHRIRMNKINPGFGQMGRGFHGRGIGRWQSNQGRCW